MDLSVIIVNYNVRYFLEQALLSVQRASKGLQVEVFVVDNASQDDSVVCVQQRFPAVHLIRNKENVGFSKANNQALELAKGRYALLLNPDTVVGEDTFRIIVDFMDRRPQAGGLGCRMIDGAGIYLPESKRGFPTPWVAFCKSAGLGRLFPHSARFNGYYLGNLSPEESHPVEVLAGAFMLLRRSVLEKTGFLDEAFFMYGEDIDLSYRVVQAGFKNWYCADTTIIHYKGESTKKGSLNYVRVFYQAMIIFARKHFSGGKARLYIGMLQGAIYSRALVSLLGNWFRKGRALLLDAFLLFAGLFIMRNFWARYHFNDPDYFPDTVLSFNAPLYISLWLGAIYFSGGYDRPHRTSRLVRGIFVGALVISAVYGFLDADYRSSRALIVLTSLWALLVLPGVRFLMHFFRFGNFRLNEPAVNRLAITGNPEEAQRARALLQLARQRKNDLGTISPNAHLAPTGTLGTIANLTALLNWYQLNELIFCSKDISYTEIIHWMHKLDPKIKYRLLPEGGDGIIGSHSKNTGGELYTADASFQIATPATQRNKRVIDILTSLIFLLASPLLVFRLGPSVFEKAFSTLLGRNSWVGYHPAALPEIPLLRPGHFSPLDRYLHPPKDKETIFRLNQLYARDYRPADDLFIIWKAVMRS